MNATNIEVGRGLCTDSRCRNITDIYCPLGKCKLASINGAFRQAVVYGPHMQFRTLFKYWFSV